jgi:hypothetical protein
MQFGTIEKSIFIGQSRQPPTLPAGRQGSTANQYVIYQYKKYRQPIL